MCPIEVSPSRAPLQEAFETLRGGQVAADAFYEPVCAKLDKVLKFERLFDRLTEGLADLR